MIRNNINTKFSESMRLLDYQGFLNEAEKIAKESFNPQDVVDSVKKFTQKIKFEEKKNVFEIWAYLTDRESQAEQINNLLKKDGYDVKQVMRSSSGSYPASEFLIGGILVRIVFKPAGGQQMTTLNSTITELVPILLWKAGYAGPADPSQILTACRSVDLSTVTWAAKSDMVAAEKYLDLFEDSSLFVEKMINAYAIYKWILTQNPKDLIWAYRTKPSVSGYSIPNNSRADIVIEGNDTVYGVSVKAKSSASAKVRKMSSTFFEALRFFGGKYNARVRSYAWNNVFSGMIQEYVVDHPDEEKVMSSVKEENCWDLDGEKQSINKHLITVIDYLYKKDPKHVDEIGYYELQKGARQFLVEMIQSNPDTWVDFIKDKAGLSNIFPVKVVVAIKDTAEEQYGESEESIAAELNQRPISVDVASSSKKEFSVKYGNSKHMYAIRNNSGGNKTAVVYRMAIEQIG